MGYPLVWLEDEDGKRWEVAGLGAGERVEVAATPSGHFPFEWSAAVMVGVDAGEGEPFPGTRKIEGWASTESEAKRRARWALVSLGALERGREVREFAAPKPDRFVWRTTGDRRVRETHTAPSGDKDQALREGGRVRPPYAREPVDVPPPALRVHLAMMASGVTACGLGLGDVEETSIWFGEGTCGACLATLPPGWHPKTPDAAAEPPPKRVPFTEISAYMIPGCSYCKAIKSACSSHAVHRTIEALAGETVCGISLDLPSLTTAHDPNRTTCAKCMEPANLERARAGTPFTG